MRDLQMGLLYIPLYSFVNAFFASVHLFFFFKRFSSEDEQQN